MKLFACPIWLFPEVSWKNYQNKNFKFPINFNFSKDEKSLNNHANLRYQLIRKTLKTIKFWKWIKILIQNGLQKWNIIQHFVKIPLLHCHDWLFAEQNAKKFTNFELTALARCTFLIQFPSRKWAGVVFVYVHVTCRETISCTQPHRQWVLINPIFWNLLFKD